MVYCYVVHSADGDLSGGNDYLWCLAREVALRCSVYVVCLLCHFMVERWFELEVRQFEM